MTEAISLFIETQEFAFWSNVEINTSLDNFSSVSFSAPFEADRAEFRETFRPFTYKPLSLHILNPETNASDALFTGTMINIDPVIESHSRSVQVSGYGAPAVMGDCSMPVETLPIEFNGEHLRDIAIRLAAAFELSVVFNAEDGARFGRVALEVSDTPASFLSKLARQRNLVMTDDVDGNLVFQQSAPPGLPVARLQQGVLPLHQVMPQFSPQEYFSEVTGFAPTKGSRLGSRFTVQNRFLNQTGDTVSTIRPKSFKLEDTDDADAPDGTNAKIGRMFGNMCSYNLEVPSWRDPQGALWTPNTTLTLLAPDAMVYNETELLVREVTLRQDPKKESATLNVVLPGAFNGAQPETLPWLE